MLLDGRPVMIGAPSDALRPNIGIGLVPEDRKSEALFLNLVRQAQRLAAGHRAVRAEAVSSIRRGRRPRSRASSSASRSSAEPYGRACRRSPAAISRRSRSPNGCWPRAASCSCSIRPAASTSAPSMRLYLLMRNYVEAGGAILFHSTEIPELVHLCDRVIVLYGGRLVAEIAAKDLTEAAIMWPRSAARCCARRRWRERSRAEAGLRLRARRCCSGSRRGRGLITAIVVFLALLLIVDARQRRAALLFRCELPRAAAAPARDRRIRRDPRHSRRRLRSVGGRRDLARQRGAGRAA